MTTIAILSASPAAGKTTTAVALSSYLGSFGARVLAVDLDPSGDAAVALRAAQTLPLRRVLESGLPLDVCLAPTAHPRVDALHPTSNGDPVQAGVSRLRDTLAPIEGRYGYVVLDCPPGTGAMIEVAIAAAHEAIIVVPAEDQSLFELTTFITEIERAVARSNPGLRLSFLSTMDDGSHAALSVARELKRRYPESSLSTVIPADAALFGTVEGESILDVAGAGARAYSDLASEIALRAAVWQVA